MTRVRGTKNPERAAVTALAPDLVIANREENRKLDVTRLREAGLAVWVTVIESVPEAMASLRRLLTGPLGLAVPAWLAAASGPGPGPRPGLRWHGPRAGSRYRSGATRGWWSARVRSPATCWRGSAWTMCSARARTATRNVGAEPDPDGRARPDPAARRALPVHRPTAGGVPRPARRPRLGPAADLVRPLARHRPRRPAPRYPVARSMLSSLRASSPDPGRTSPPAGRRPARPQGPAPPGRTPCPAP